MGIRKNNPQEIIEAFRSSNVQWIVSVAMVSEGTDIPRLRVCVHLSNVRTELFYRQVLGRILRQMQGFQNRRAFFITFAEQSMMDFTNRLKQDVPEVVVRLEMFEKTKKSVQPGSITKGIEKTDPKLDNLVVGNTWQAGKGHPDEQKHGATLAVFRLQGQYRQKVFSIF